MKGSKWIFNKWMCMYDNFKKFPCQLSPKMRFIPPSHQNQFIICIKSPMASSMNYIIIFDPLPTWQSILLNKGYIVKQIFACPLSPTKQFNRPYVRKSLNDGITILDFRLITQHIMLTIMTYLHIPTRFSTELPDMDFSFSTQY